MERDVPVLRSKLFVPGNRQEWMEKAGRFGSDALVLDLEDSVPDREKAFARRVVHDFIDGHGSDRTLFVRINGLGSKACLDDLEAVVQPGLTGIRLPKTSGAEDVTFIDRLLGLLEDRAGMPTGTILITPVIETAEGVRAAYEIGRASTRIAYMGGLGVRGGDLERSVGYRWSEAGMETWTIRSQVLIAARAAGIRNPMSGVWVNLDDLDGLRAFAEQNRCLGYEGMSVIHPSHVAVVNEVFAPTESEMSYYRELLSAMDEAEAAGTSATVFRGEMVDTAMVKTARLWLSRAASAS